MQRCGETVYIVVLLSKGFDAKKKKKKTLLWVFGLYILCKKKKGKIKKKRRKLLWIPN
jgi:hypothetical protein